MLCGSKVVCGSEVMCAQAGMCQLSEGCICVSAGTCMLRMLGCLAPEWRVEGKWREDGGKVEGNLEVSYENQRHL